MLACFAYDKLLIEKRNVNDDEKEVIQEECKGVDIYDESLSACASSMLL